MNEIFELRKKHNLNLFFFFLICFIVVAVSLIFFISHLLFL